MINQSDLLKKLIKFLRDRSSRPDVFCEKFGLRNFAKFTGKHLRQSLFFNKVAGLKLISKNTFFTEHLWTTASNDGTFCDNC